MLRVGKASMKAAHRKGALDAAVRLASTNVTPLGIPGPSTKEGVAPYGSPAFYTDLYCTLQAEFGDVVHIQPGIMGPEQVLLFHPEDIGNFVRQEGKNPLGSTASLKPFQFYFTDRTADFVATATDEKWRSLRSALQKRFFNPKDVPDYLPNLEKATKLSVQALPGHAENILQHLCHTTFDMVNSILIGFPLGISSPDPSDADPQDVEYVKTTRTAWDRMMICLSKPEVTEAMLKDHHSCPEYLEFKESMDWLMTRGEKLLERCYREIEEGKPGPCASYVANLACNKELTYEQIMGNVLGFIFAGVDTTGVSMSWLLWCLATNPEQQSDLRQLTFEALGSTPGGPSLPLTPENWGKVSHLRWAFKESMRLYPLVAGSQRFVPEGSGGVTIRGHTLPEGTQIQLLPSPYYCHPDIWGGKSKEFIYRRWDRTSKESFGQQADQTSPEDPYALTPAMQNHPFMFMFFGKGPRMCIGTRIAEMEAVTWVAELLQNYEVKLASGDPNEMRIDTSAFMGKPSFNPDYQFIPLN